MAHILSAAEAANVLRCAQNDPNMLDLLPLVDDHINSATGRDWTADATIYPAAKAAARMLLVRWHEDPGGMAAGKALGFGLGAVMVQLKALALELAQAGVPSEALAVTATNLVDAFAVDAALVLIFNHVMSPGATAAVTLTDAGGDVIATTNALDVTGKILTITPDDDLDEVSAYTIVLDHPADVYGQTLDTTLGFWTAD